MLAALLLSSAGMNASATTFVPIICIRNTDKDPSKIRHLFKKIDQMDVDALEKSPVLIYLSTDDPDNDTSMSETVRSFNFHDEKEDNKPLRVMDIRRVDISDNVSEKFGYAVKTVRSVWVDRGSNSPKSYQNLEQYWLVGFQGCDIRTVREAQNLAGFLTAKK